jgi:hypothetical protein
MKKIIIILAFLPLLSWGQYQTTNLDFLFNGSIQASDSTLIDSITGTANSNYKLTDIDFDITLGYLPGKTKAKLNGQPITTFFQNANYADTVFTQWLDHETNVDSTESKPYRIKRIAHYSTATVDVNNFFKTPIKGVVNYVDVSTTIDAAVIAASSGDSIYIYDGVYVENNATTNNLRINKNVKLFCVGNVTIKASGGASEVVIFQTSTANALLKGAQIDGESTYANCIDFETRGNLRNCYITNPTATYIVSSNLLDTVNQCVLIGSGGSSGILGHNMTATENYLDLDVTYAFYSNQVSGNKVSMYNDFYSNHTTTAIDFLRSNGNYNIAYNNYHINGTLFATIRMFNGFVGDIRFKGNYFEINTTTGGIVITQPAGANYDVEYLDNEFNFIQQGALGSCIRVDDQSDVLIQGNKFTNNTTTQFTYIFYVKTLIAATSNIQVLNNEFNVNNHTGYGISFGTEATNVNENTISDIIIEGNKFKGDGDKTNNFFHSIFIGFQNNPTIRYNNVDSTGYGIVLKAETNVYTSEKINGNVFTNNNFGVRIKGVSGVELYNNTIDNCDAGIYISDDEGAGQGINNVLKNNIISNCTNLITIASGGGISESNYNILYNGLINGGTFAAWQGGGYDANSYDSNPNFKATTELWPVSPSNARGNGVNLGSTYQLGLDTQTVWPDSVITTTQLSKWSIGAYIVPLASTLIRQGNTLISFQSSLLQHIPSIYNPDALALFARMSVQPSDDEKQIYSDAIDSLQKHGIWDSLDYIYSFGVHTEQAALLNWITPTNTAINVGATFDDYFGFTGNGSSSYVNSNYNPLQEGVKYTQSNAILGISMDSVSGIGAYHGATIGTASTFVIPNLGGTAYGRCNSSNNLTLSNGNINGVFTAGRQNSSDGELYVDTIRNGGSTTLTLPPDGDLYLLARNNNGSPLNFSANNINFSFAGANLLQSQTKELVAIIKQFNEDIRNAALLAALSPDSSASSNRANLQALLNGGNIDITLTEAGRYKLDSTLYLESNTTLTFSEGVILQKDAVYSNVFLNKSSLIKEIDSNITITGLELEVNGYEKTWEHVYGQRAQLGFLGIKNLTIRDFYCDDLGSLQFCIYAGNWENILYEDLYIEGDKDGLDFLGGHGAIIRNYTAKTYDDGVFIGGNGFPTAQLEFVSDVYDMQFINYRYIDSSKVLNARGCYMYVNSWLDWTNGYSYQTGDFCLNNSKIYQVSNAAGFSGIGTVAPVHSSGIVTGGDGVSWHHLQDGDFYSNNIYNISFDSCLFYDPFAAILAPRTSSVNNRNIYPGTEDSTYISNVTINNSTISNTTVLDMQVGLNDVTVSGNIFDSITNFVRAFLSIDSDTMEIVSRGNTFTNSNNFYGNINPKHVYVNSDNEQYSNSTFVNAVGGGGTLRAINYDLPFTDKSKITPVLNDTCRFTDGLHYWNSSSWILIP